MAQDTSQDALDRIRRKWPAEFTSQDGSFLEFVVGLTIVDQLIEREFQRVAQSQFGMTPGDLRILFALRRSGSDEGLRPSELFSQLIITPGAVTKQLDRLEERALVERKKRKPDGKRASMVRLTEQGQSVADEAMVAVTQLPITRAAYDALSDDDQHKALEVLHALIRQIQSHIELTPID